MRPSSGFLSAQNAAIQAEAPLQCAAVRIQATWREKRRLWTYRSQRAAALILHVRREGHERAVQRMPLSFQLSGGIAAKKLSLELQATLTCDIS